jgi:hypothetical protein
MGNHDSLMAKGGIYYELVSLQTGNKKENKNKKIEKKAAKKSDTDTDYGLKSDSNLVNTLGVTYNYQE